MPIFQELLNLDKEIEQSSFEGLAFINDWSNDTEEQRKQIFEQLTTQYMQGDKVSMLPSCDCGAFREGVGLICPYCNTIVKNNIEKEIQTMVQVSASLFETTCAFLLKTPKSSSNIIITATPKTVISPG